MEPVEPRRRTLRITERGGGIVLVLLLELVLDQSGFDETMRDRVAVEVPLEGSKGVDVAAWQNRR
jgi:hypothetical protein